MHTTEDLLKEINAILENHPYNRQPESLYDPVRYVLAQGGKRIRPTLMMLAYELYKDHPEDIILPAVGLETYHNYTLLHEDLMDNADMRRGNLTVHKRWNANTAILSGDSMLVLAYKCMQQVSDDKLRPVLEIFTETALQVGEGQQYDMDFEALDKVSMDQYMQMIGLKTAVLIACSAKMGALIAGADDEDAGNLYRYGYALGLAFQIADDWLDAFGNEKVFGKPIGGDIINKKKCWLTIKASELDGAAMDEAMAMPVDTDEQKSAKIKAVKDIYVRLGVDKMAQEEILRLTEEAMDAVEELDLGKVRYEMLKRFADKLIGRKN